MLASSEFGDKAQKIKIREISVHIDWKAAADDRSYNDRSYYLYAIVVLELNNKTKRVSLYNSRYQKYDGKIDSLGLAILYLVQGHTISKPKKDSENIMWIHYVCTKFRKQIRKKIQGFGSRKSVIEQIEKFKDKEKRNAVKLKLKPFLMSAYDGGIRKQDVINIWDEIVNESIVKKVMED